MSNIIPYNRQNIIDINIEILIMVDINQAKKIIQTDNKETQ